MFFDLAFSPVSQEKSTLEYQNETFMQKPVPFTQDGGLWTTNEGKKKKEGVVGGVLLGTLGRDRQSERLPRRHWLLWAAPPTLLCPIKVFSGQTRPIRGLEWWLSLPLSGVTVRPITVTARQDLSGTEKERPAITAPCEMYFWVGMLLFGVGGESPENFFLKSVQWVREGIWCLGLGNGLLGTDSSAPHWVVKASKRSCTPPSHMLGWLFPPKKNPPKFRNQLLSSRAINNKHWMHIYYFYWLLQ